MKTRVSAQKKAEIRPFLASLGKTSRAAKGQLAEAYYAGGFVELVGKAEAMNLVPRSEPWQWFVIRAIQTLPKPDEAIIDFLLRSNSLPPRVQKVAEEWWLPAYTESIVWVSSYGDPDKYDSLEEAQQAHPDCEWFYKTTYWQVRGGPNLTVSCVGIPTGETIDSITYYDDSQKYREEYSL